jgi:hypothetical protein
MRKKYTLLLLATFLIFAAGFGCTGVTGSATSTTTSTLTTASGKTIFVTATTEGSDVATDKAVFAQFGSALDASTVTNANVSVSPSVSFKVDYDSVNNIAILRPLGSWDADTPYKVTVGTGVKTKDGDSLAAPFQFMFTTRGTPDLSPPNLLATGGACVAATGPLALRFGEELDSLTVNASTVSVAGVTGTATYDAQTSTILWYPSTSLTAGATYTATLTSGIKDLGGVAFAGGTVNFNVCAQTSSGPPPGKNLCTGNGVDWHLNAHLNLLLNQHFEDAANNFFMIGLTNGNHITWDATGVTALDAFLGQAEPGEPITPPSGGFLSLFNFPGHVNLFSGDTAFATDIAGLQLNVLFNGFDATDATYGHLVVSGTGNAALDGLTVSEILSIAEQYFATGQLPSGISSDEFIHLVRNINLAFHGCKESDWSKTHLVLVANLHG